MTCLLAAAAVIAATLGLLALAAVILSGQLDDR
jgi:nitrogen fixation-related uncharacterized protein